MSHRPSYQVVKKRKGGHERNPVHRPTGGRPEVTDGGGGLFVGLLFLLFIIALVALLTR